MKWHTLKYEDNGIAHQRVTRTVQAADVPAGCILNIQTRVFVNGGVAEALLYVPHCTVEMLQRDSEPPEVVSNAK
jgi:hypothetical protein